MLYYILPNNIRLIEKNYPGWGVLFRKLSDKSLKAGDVNDALGLSYRQLNDWEDRGIIKTIVKRPFAKKTEGWRKFAIIDLIPLGILIALKKQGVPITKLIKVIDTLKLYDLLLNQLIPNLIYGVKTYFYTDLDNWTGYDCVNSNDDSLNISAIILKESNVLIVLPLNTLMDDIISNLNLSDFQAIKNEKTNNYDFIINGVPLALEELSKTND